jgi:hypothetical protein
MADSRELVTIGDRIFIEPTFEHEVPMPYEGRSVTVRVAVEVAGGRARARSLTVTSDAPSGVTSTDLRDIHLRDVVLWAAVHHVQRLELRGRRARLVDVQVGDPPQPPGDVVDAVRRLVGYLRDPEVPELPRRRRSR